MLTVKGFTEATKYMLAAGVPYVMSNVYCQDPIEEHFGRHRGLGRRSRNPSIYEYGYITVLLQLNHNASQPIYRQ